MRYLWFAARRSLAVCRVSKRPHFLRVSSAFPTFHLYSGGHMVQLIRGADRGALQRAITAHSADLTKSDPGEAAVRGPPSGRLMQIWFPTSFLLPAFAWDGTGVQSSCMRVRLS